VFLGTKLPGGLSAGKLNLRRKMKNRRRRVRNMNHAAFYWKSGTRRVLAEFAGGLSHKSKRLAAFSAPEILRRGAQ